MEEAYHPCPITETERRGLKFGATFCRAYKLGKKRHSYNMLNVKICDAKDSYRWVEPTCAVKVISQESNSCARSTDCPAQPLLVASLCPVKGLGPSVKDIVVPPISGMR